MKIFSDINMQDFDFIGFFHQLCFHISRFKWIKRFRKCQKNDFKKKIEEFVVNAALKYILEEEKKLSQVRSSKIKEIVTTTAHYWKNVY